MTWPPSPLSPTLSCSRPVQNALQVYDQHADRLLAEDSDRVLKNLHSVIGHVRDNPSIAREASRPLSESR